MELQEAFDHLYSTYFGELQHEREEYVPGRLRNLRETALNRRRRKRFGKARGPAVRE